MTKRTAPWIETLFQVVRIPQAAFGLIFISITLFSALFASFIAPVEPETMDFDYLLSGFSAEHLLGTDQLGRDTLSRLIHGARIALLVSVGSIGLGVFVGVPLGLIAVYFGGWTDDIIMRVMDSLVVFPSLLIAVALAAALAVALVVALAVALADAPAVSSRC